MDMSLALPAARSTAGSVFARTDALFGGAGTVHNATLTIDAAARVPRFVRLLTAGQTSQLLVKTGDEDAASSVVRTVCLKFPDAYGPGRDQDFLLASSGDGAPLHHVTLPIPATAPALYSSLWLYLAGITPVLFGLRTDGSELREGAHAEFCVSAPVGKFHPIGTVTWGKPAHDGAELTFAGSHSGGNIRPLPPVAFY